MNYFSILNKRLTTIVYLLLMLHVHCRFAAALLPIITNPGSSLAQQIGSRTLQAWGKGKKRHSVTHTVF